MRRDWCVVWRLSFFAPRSCPPAVKLEIEATFLYGQLDLAALLDRLFRPEQAVEGVYEVLESV